MHVIPWLLGGAGLVALTVALWPERKAAPRVALIGDSLALGLTRPLGQLAGPAFRAQGIVSTTPAQWATGTYGDWVAGFAPTLTLVSLGTNDIGYSPAPPAGPYQQIVRKFPNVVWIMPPMMPGDRLAGVRSVIASLGVPVVPAMTGLSFGADHIHPLNYAPWASFIWGHIR